MKEQYVTVTLPETDAKNLARLVKGYRLRGRSGLSAGERSVLHYFEVLLGDALHGRCDDVQV